MWQVVTVVRIGGRAEWRYAATSALLALVVGLSFPGPARAASTANQPIALVLVTFDGPGTAGYRGPLDSERYRALIDRRQDAALAAVSAPVPVYRWTTALNGVAVELTQAQVDRLRSHPRVAAIEENSVRPLAGAAAASLARPAHRTRRGGAGVVIGVVDTGIWPESPLFADSPAQRPRPDRFAASCPPAEDWPADACNDKLVAAEWFVAGFGEDRIAADEPLSPRDVRGHGTQVASIAAGNARVPVRARGLRGGFGGIAPRAGIAAYKACWSAPDPDDDGCATADLVTAIDRATADGVDVLNLSVAGAPGIDTVERALLGAAEAGAVVVAAAGNDGGDGYATHVAPWVTTVGAATGPSHAGEVVLGRQRLAGVMTAGDQVSGRIVAGATIPAPGWSRREAAVCVPGALDAARADGRIVVCKRGSIGRTVKSAAVERSGGVGMVLVNVRGGAPTHDLHAVPTVHLGRDAGSTLAAWLRGHPRGAVTLAPVRSRRDPQRVARWSPGGDPTASFVKPDVVAPGAGILGAVPPSVAPQRWAFLSGTSSATAWTSGAAGVLVARHDWSAQAVRSALASSGRKVGNALQGGAGVPRLGVALRTRLVHDVRPGAYRAWLAGRLDDVNTPSLLFHGAGTAVRRVTNVGGRADTWLVSVTGFERYDVTVAPAAVTLLPGRSTPYRVTVRGGSVAGGLDEGTVTWRAPDGSAIRVPVAIGR